MLAGYLTFDEIRIITGYSKTELEELIKQGLKYKEMSVKLPDKRYSNEKLFDVREVEEWIRMHLH